MMGAAAAGGPLSDGIWRHEDQPWWEGLTETVGRFEAVSCAGCLLALSPVSRVASSAGMRAALEVPCSGGGGARGH